MEIHRPTLQADRSSAACPRTGVAVTEAEIARAFGADIAALDAYRLVIVEGELRSELSSLAGLKAAEIEVDRKMLADLAVRDEAAFTALVEVALAAQPEAEQAAS